MPRQAHGRPLQRPGPSKPPKRKPAKGRGLNALQIAEEQNPETVKIKQHRLGESYDDDDEPVSRADADERSSKRRKISQDGEDEDMSSGSDLDGERWHVGVEEDDEDSDIDSDEAFGESDEDKFADFTFRGSQHHAERSTKKGDRSDEEDEEDEDDDFGDEGVDLATALDMNEEDEKGPKPKKRRRSPTPEQESASDDDSAQSDEDKISEDESDHDSGLSVSDDDAGDHDRLQTFVQSISKDPQTDQPSTVSAPSKISASDLLQYVKDPQQRQSLKILQNNEVKAPEHFKGGIPGRLAVPLAKRQQDRLDRVAAYDETKKELGKWVDTVKQNRRAEHLMFPLVDPDAAAAVNSQIAPISQSKNMSALESKIQDILKESGMTERSAEKAEQEFEELQEKKMPLAEVQARRAELRKARDLMFREEIRAKRIKKIKSKAYRRIHRKERERLGERERATLAAEGLLDSDEEKEKNDRRRAEERMGARHRESKWAKAVKATGRAAWDEDARGGVGELARRDEELRRRVEGKEAKGSDFSESESESDGYNSDVDEEDLQARLDAVSGRDDNQPTGRLANMAFMKKADAARKAENDAELRTIRQSLNANDAFAQADESDDEDGAQGGRQSFGIKQNTARPSQSSEPANKNEFEERLSDDEEDEAETEAGVQLNSSSKSTDQPSAATTKETAPPTLSTSASPLKNTKTQPKSILKPTPTPQSQPLTTPLSPSSDSEPETPAQHEPQSLSEAIFFGDDDIPSSFAKEKAADAAEDDEWLNPVEEKGAMPGWGSWTGQGMKKRRPNQRSDHSSQKQQRNGQQQIQQKNGAKTGTILKKPLDPSRKDANLSNVIISERQSKKNKTYMASELPYPFETRAQYERSLRVPLGGEWNTVRDAQEGVRPRVLVKQGVIRAVRKPIV
jgi:U3 small nucleolar RNA-associated protein 14